MKRILSAVLCAALLLALGVALCGCPALEQETASGKPQVHITVGKEEGCVSK